MLFSQLAKYLQKLEGTGSRNDMTVILAELFAKADSEEARLIAYMTQGKLGPAYKSPDFGVADKSMLKALGPEAEKLFKQKGDLGLVVEQIKSQIPNPKSQINHNPSISQVHKQLLKIAGDGGTGSQERKQESIRKLLNELDAVSAKYAVKIILGKLRTGFSDMTVLDSLSWMLAGDKSLRKNIETIYNVRADLGEVAKIIKNFKLKIKNLSVDPQIGTPVLMARAERAKTPQEIWERNGECALEYKLDGLRIQAHITDSVTLFSRGLENVTHMYPDIVEGLQKQIKQDCIVEGEMIAVGKAGRFLPFQETAQRKRKYDISEMIKKVPLKIFLFDVLLLNKTNRERREELEKLVKPGEVVKLMPRIVIEKEEEIEKYFREAVAAGTEGIIAKKLDGLYQAGARDFSWIKYKKSYDKSSMADTLDVVVMGYDEGQGKRSKFGIGDFLVGVYDLVSEKYMTVAKIGTGLTDDEWMRMKKLLVSISKKPEDFVVSTQMKCDHWVNPKVVVEILADEITKSPMHTSGYALRFPRLVTFREKKPEDATTSAEVEKMFKLQQESR